MIARAARAVLVLGAVLACASFAGCGTVERRAERTGGLELDFLWTHASEGRVGYYEVRKDGEFRSAGGRKARDRETTFRTDLSDGDVARFLELLRATDYATRADEQGDGEPVSEVKVRDGIDRWSFSVRGQDASVDALRSWLHEMSMRQYRDILQAQPEAGPRKR